MYNHYVYENPCIEVCLNEPCIEVDLEMGAKGEDGKNATINGVSTLNIEAGENISLEQEGSTLTISGTYEYDDTNVKAEIAENTRNISNLGNKVDENTESIESNTAAINTNKQAIESNSLAIEGNTNAIEKNASDIVNNSNAIDRNTENISSNTNAISSNTSAIAKNTTAINENKSAIEKNTTAIQENKTNIDTNTQEINNLKQKSDDNKNSIDEINENLKNYSLITETGNKIDVTVNSSTYVMTLDLKDKNDNVLSTGSVDLPIESMIINVTYDSEKKELKFTLQNGNVIEVPLNDLISGLVTDESLENTLKSYALIKDVPTQLSELNSDSTHRTVSDTEKSTWNNKVDTSTYNSKMTQIDTTLGNKANISDIPTKTSDLTNDSDFTTKAYVDGLVGDIDTALDLINGEVIS